MPRRPALGTIAINSFYNKTASSTTGVAANLKTSIRTTTTNKSTVSDENAVSAVIKSSKPFDYEIYTDESSAESRKSVQFVDEVEDVELKSQSSSLASSSSNKENHKLVTVIESDEEEEDDDDDTCNDQEDFDDSDNDVSDFDDEEEVTHSSNSECIESSEDDDDEEDPIVRLDSVQQLDSSILSINLNMSSPMACDENRFYSRLEEEEEEDEEEKENRVIDEYDRKMRHEENVLFNLIDYRDDCVKYMRQLELELRPDPNYMRKQIDISSSMRAVLVDWLVDVMEEYKLSSETLFLSVNYLDRFLSKMGVPRNKLQLLGITSMYIASKCEELMPPGVKEFIYITDNTYSNKQLTALEQQMLPTLSYRVNQPTINWFLDFHFKSISMSTGLSLNHDREKLERIKCLAHYLAELTLLDSDTYLRYLPSQIAASALYVALHTFGKSWTRQIAELVDYELTDQLKMCILDVFKTFQDTQSPDFLYHAIQTRYRSQDMLQTSLVTPPSSLPFYK